MSRVLLLGLVRSCICYMHVNCFIVHRMNNNNDNNNNNNNNNKQNRENNSSLTRPPAIFGDEHVDEVPCGRFTSNPFTSDLTLETEIVFGSHV